MEKIVLVDKKTNAVEFARFLSARSLEFSNVKVMDRSDVVSAPDLCLDVRYIFSTWHMPVLSRDDVANYFPSLEAVFYAAGDVSYFSDSFVSRGVKIFSAQYENSIPVAEFVLGQILLANKGYFQAEREYRRGFWRFGFRRARALSMSQSGNYSAKIGIIGLGTVGALVAHALRTLSLQVLVHDPFVSDERINSLGAARANLEEIFAVCDVISNHLPDLPETRGILDYGLFSLMKPTATFINTGRGRQVDEKGLLRAMRDFPSRTALLDVTAPEPPNPFSSLSRAKNIFLTPHIAGSQGGEIERLYLAILNRYFEFKVTDCASEVVIQNES